MNGTQVLTSVSIQVHSVSRESILPANPHILDGVDNLIQLSYLNEPAALHNIKYRYANGFIYVSMLLNRHYSL